MPLYNIDLFAGAGGLSLGLKLAGFKTLLLNDKDKNCAKTLISNFYKIPVHNNCVSKLNLDIFKNSIDVLTAGLPCQPYSFAGNKKGLDDDRGAILFNFLDRVKECLPKLLLIENVKGLLTHDNGNSLKFIINKIENIGYRLLSYKILNACFFDVPQKRERLFLVFTKDNLNRNFIWPAESVTPKNIADALKAGQLYPNDVPISPGEQYSLKKAAVLAQIPPGGCWRNLPIEAQKAYMGAHWYSSGGRTGVARRIAWSEPCLTLTCRPQQKKTERCHPDETRPFTIREYARIQTFPDSWYFSGSISSQYRQIGNAVPVNLAFHISKSILNYFEDNKNG